MNVWRGRFIMSSKNFYLFVRHCSEVVNPSISCVLILYVHGSPFIWLAEAALAAAVVLAD